MADAESRFRDHVSLCQEYSSLRLSEADTRAYLVDPLLRILGYEGVGDLRREVSVQATKEAVDYLLMVDGQPRVIVEAKALRNNLTDQHAAQCVQYATILGVRWCLITNGLRWAVFDAQGKGPLADKRVAEVSFDDDFRNTDDAWAVLSSFSQDALAKASPITNLLVERVVTDELGRPDSRAVEALRRVVSSRFGERVSGQVVVSAIHRVMTKMITGETKTAMTSQTEAQSGLSVSKDTTSPVVRRSELVGSAGESLQQDNPLSAKAAGAKRITLADLVEAGVLPSDATLTATVRGVTHTAFLRNAMLEVDGREYSTPSAASIAVRNVRSWNGWNDWRYQGQSLHDLRERLGTSLNTPRGGE